MSAVYHQLRLLLATALFLVISGVIQAAESVNNWIANGDFTANAAAFTASPGSINNSGNPAAISGWLSFGAGSSPGLNGSKTGASVGNPCGPTTPGSRTYAFIRYGQGGLSQYLTLAPNTPYRMDFDVAARAGYTDQQYRVVIAPSDTTGMDGLYYDSGVQAGNSASFTHVTGTFTTPATLGAKPNIQLWNVSGSGDKTIAYANVTLRLASLPCFLDDFNDGNDTGWTHYNPVAGSAFVFPALAGSVAYQLTAPMGSASSPGRIGSFRMDEPTRTKFHVEADVLNWSADKGQFIGVMARVQSPLPANGDFPGGYALVLKIPKLDPAAPPPYGPGSTDQLFILKINAGATAPTVLNTYDLQGYNINNGGAYPAPGAGGYRFVFWSDGNLLKGQVIDKNTGIPLIFYDGVTPVSDPKCMTNTLVVTDPGTYPSGRSGLFSYVRIVSSTAQGVDPTFDNFYSAADAPDTTPPGLICPANKTIGMNLNQSYATGVALGTPVTSDNSGGTVTVWNDAPVQYPMGVTTIHWYGHDPSGNTTTATQTVTVNDTQAPTLTCPADVTLPANASGVATSVSLGTPVTGDNCRVAAVANNAPAVFPLGTNIVTWTVTDGSSNQTTGTQKVIVQDTTPPTLTCPADVTVSANANGVATNVSLGTPVTGDNCSVATVSNTAPTTYQLGTTTVTWTVTDGSNNKTTGIQRVIVQDTTPPTLTCPADVTVSANANGVAVGVSLGTPVFGDNCSVASVSNNKPATYPLGTTVVTWTVRDSSYNKTTGTQQVIVRDTTPPTLTCPANVTVPVNSGSTAVGVSLGTPVTGDNCSVVSTRNNAPAAFPLGTNDVTWTVTDGSGNTTSGTQQVSAVWLSSNISNCATQNGIFTFTWFGRKLQQTDDLSQPFTDVPEAGSPYSEPITPPRKFFRAW
ncbi:MAG: HYR domain-containing protein [Verrucomicrobiota bacterium]